MFDVNIRNFSSIRQPDSVLKRKNNSIMISHAQVDEINLASKTSNTPVHVNKIKRSQPLSLPQLKMT